MGCKKETTLNFVIAHSQEARPLIDYYRLNKNNRHNGFNVFENENVRLVVSGQGKLNAAAATAYLAGIYASRASSGIWANVGVAGHRDHSIGSLWRANKVTEAISDRSIYPVLLQNSRQSSTQINGCVLKTVATPESDYLGDCLYDMEAAGFFQTAVRFATLEAIACFKVVSDNLAHPHTQAGKKSTAILLQPHLSRIDKYLKGLKPLIHFNKRSQVIDIKHIKLTRSQQEIVTELITGLRVHGLEYQSAVSQSDNARQLITALTDKLKSVELLV